MKSKRFISALIAAVMLIGTLSGCLQNIRVDDTPALKSVPFKAAAGESGESTSKGIVYNKTFTQNEDNPSSGILTLETYSTGSLVSMPIDAVLLLDISNSMKNDITGSTTTTQTVGKLENYTSLSTASSTGRTEGYYYFIGNDGVKYNLEYRRSTGVWRYRAATNGTWANMTNTVATNFGNPDVLHDETTTTTQTKIEALRAAAAQFVDIIAADATAKNVEHKVTIITYHDTASTVSNALSVNNTANVTTLKNQISRLNYQTLSRTSGNTYPSNALDSANTLLRGVTRDSVKMVLLMSDGAPAAYGDSWTKSIADSGIVSAEKVKSIPKTESGLDTTVWSVGLLSSSDESGNAGNFLKRASSNYRNGTSFDNYGTQVANKYYENASSGAALNDIFTGIANETVYSASKLKSDAVVMDEITEFFELPAGLTATGVNVKTADWDGSKFGNATTFTDAVVEVETANEETGLPRIYVTNFDFAANVVVEGRSGGKKLIIEIPIEINVDYFASEDAEISEDGTYPTNTERSAIYVNNVISDDNIIVELGTAEAEFQIPETQISVVEYIDGLNGKVFDKETYAVAEGDNRPEFVGARLGTGVTLTVGGSYVGTDNETYIFQGWTPTLADKASGEKTTYTATWKYVIQYKTGYGDNTVIDSKVQASGEDTFTIDDPTRTGYVFKGWTPAVAAKVTGSATYTATWNELYLIQYKTGYGDNAVIDSKNQENGEDTFTIVDPTRTGYVFKCWDPTVAAKVTEDATYTATWEARNDTPYKVEYYLQDKGTETFTRRDDATDNMTGTTDTTATADTTKVFYGYTFDKDNTNNVLSGTIAADGSLVLKVYYTIDTFTVVHESDKSVDTFYVVDYCDSTGRVSFNVTALVKSGYLYSGLAFDNTFGTRLGQGQADKNEELRFRTGLDLDVKDGDVYYLCETDQFFYGYASFVTVTRPDVGGKKITDIYGVTALDRDDYIECGFTADGINYRGLKCDLIEFKDENDKVVKTIATANENDKLVAIDLGITLFKDEWKASDLGFTYLDTAAARMLNVNEYWVTIDGVKVTNRYCKATIGANGTFVAVSDADFTTTVCTEY